LLAKQARGAWNISGPVWEHDAKPTAAVCCYYRMLFKKTSKYIISSIYEKMLFKVDGNSYHHSKIHKGSLLIVIVVGLLCTANVLVGFGVYPVLEAFLGVTTRTTMEEVSVPLLAEESFLVVDEM
jgi:hypothetical protein